MTGLLIGTLLLVGICSAFTYHKYDIRFSLAMSALIGVVCFLDMRIEGIDFLESLMLSIVMLTINFFINLLVHLLLFVFYKVNGRNTLAGVLTLFLIGQVLVGQIITAIYGY